MTTTVNNEHKNIKVPNLRFKEFQGEWEKKTIGEIATIKNGPFGSVLHAEDYVDEGMPIVTTEHFKNGSLPLSKNGIPQVSEDDYCRLKGYMLEKDDIVFSRVGSVDINAHVEQVQQGWLFSGRVLRVRPIKSVNSLCLHYVLSTESVKRDIRNRAVGQTMPSINTPILSNTGIYMSQSKAEQKKIASLLSLIDERISTQNKIIEKLQSLIKGICNNYFEKLSVQEEANLIRLSDVLKERNEYCSKDGKFIHGTLSKDGIFPKTGRWDRDFLVKQEDKKYKVTHLDDICYNPANLKFGVICRNTFGDLIFSPIYVTFEVCKNVNIGFMELYLTNHNFIEKVRRFEQGTVYERMAVSPEDFLSYKIRIPSYSDQTFFYKKVQWLITLSQNEMKLLSQYKKLRQYLLREMFI